MREGTAKTSRPRRLTRLIAMCCVALSLTGLLPRTALAAIPKTQAGKTGVTVHKNDKASIDASNLSEGYVIIRYTGGRDVKIKAQVTKAGGSSYTYDINPKGNAEVIPLTEDDGRYTIGVFENISGTRYAQAYSVSVDVKLRDALLPFLYPNQYVNFTEKSAVATKAAELAKDAKDQLAILENVYFFVVRNLTYDTVGVLKPGLGR